jgi:hypothetical protein
MARSESTTHGVARSLMHVLTDAVVKVRTGMLPAEQEEKYKAVNAWLEGMEADISPLMQDVFGELAQNEALPKPTRAILDLLLNNKNQFNIILDFCAVIGAAIVAFPEWGAVMNLETVQMLWAQHPNNTLPVDLISDALNRGIIDSDTGHAEALKTGWQDPQLSWMTQLTGEPPGPVDMVNLWRWGRITEDQLDAGLLFSRLNEAYVPMFKLLSQGYMSPADAIELAIKEVVTLPQAQEYFQMAGGEPDQFQILYEAAGDALGVIQGTELLNQGLITEADFTQILGRSRINPIFYPMAQALTHKFLQPYQISAMLKAGTATAEQAAVWMTNLGYGPDQVQAFVGGSPSATIATAKSETEAMILQEYAEGIITAQAANNALVNIGYNSDQAAMLTGLQDAKASKAERDTAVSGIKSAMVEGKVSAAQAENDLTSLGIPASTINGYLKAWAVEATTKVKTLTVAEIAKAANNDFITWADAISRFQAMGYSQSDADVLAANYGGGPLVANPGT